MRRFSKFLTIIMILVLLMNYGITVEAAKPGTVTTPKPITIELDNKTLTVEEGSSSLSFTIDATYGDDKELSNISWDITPKDTSNSDLLGYDPIEPVTISKKTVVLRTIFNFSVPKDVSSDTKYSYTLKLSDTNSSDSMSLFITVTNNDTVAPVDPVPELVINYVALGDSIATGTIAPSLGTNKPYIDYFYEYLVSEYDIVNYDKYVTDGDKTSDLLSKLRSNELLKSDLFNADVITISIGGNNLMQAAKYTLFWDVTYYDFDRINFTLAEAGRLAFQTEWVEIMNELDILTDGKVDGLVDAKIIVNNIYNPYSLGDLLRDKVNWYMYNSDINGINDIIHLHSNTTTIYKVADVYGAFDTYSGSKEDMNLITYMYISDLYLGIELRNPHPTVLGHQLISNLNIQVFTSF